MITDRATATTRIRELLGDLMGTLSADSLARALDDARIPDAAGFPPGSTGYADTIDVYWAAAELVEFCAIQTLSQPTLNKFTAEGATFDMAPPRLYEMAAKLRAKSVLAAAHNTQTFTPIEINTGATYVPTSRKHHPELHPDLDWS